MADRDLVLNELIGQKVQDVVLTTELLQENAGGDSGDEAGSASEDERPLRVPTAVATLPDHGLVVVGFDSGEVQTYSGFPSALSVAAGFRIADAQPVLFVRHLDKWNPFHNVEINADLGERCASTDFGSTCNNQKRLALLPEVVQHNAVPECWKKARKDMHQLPNLDQSLELSPDQKVFYASSGGDVTLWQVVEGEVKLPWIKFRLPEGVGASVTDSALCPAMRKMLVATDRGRLLVYRAAVNSANDKMAHVEDNQIVKVAHEGAVTCVSSNSDGSLAVTGGKDGKICIWIWGGDEFLHQAGFLVLTNLSVLCALFSSAASDEVLLSLDTHVLGLHVTRRTSQVLVLQQDGRRHITMTPAAAGKLVGPTAFVPLAGYADGKERLYLALRGTTSARSGGTLQVVGNRISVPVSTRSDVLAFHHTSCALSDGADGSVADGSVADGDDARNEVVVTAVAVLEKPQKPAVHFWVRRQ